MKLLVRNASGQTSPSAWRHLRISWVFLRALPLHPQTESRPWRRRSSQWGHDLGHVTKRQRRWAPLSAVERRWAPLSPQAQLSNRHKLVGNRWNGSILEVESCSSLLRLLLAVDGCILYHSFAFQKSWRLLKIYVPSLSKSSNTSRTSTVLTIKRLVHNQIAGCHWPLEVGSQKSTDHPKSAPLDSDSTSAFETTAIWCEAILDATWCCIRCK